MTVRVDGAPLVLASASPRRRALLRQIGIEPAVVDPPAVVEAPLAGELPGPHARRLALAKAVAVRDRHGGAFVLAADTVVARGRRILPKAEDAETARACLHLLSGARHRVYGGLAVIAPDGRRALKLVRTVVQMKPLTASQIDAYLAGGDWHGKAGGYAIQGPAAAFVPWINGSYSNVVGLPLYETAAALTGLGFRWRAT